MRYVLKTLAFKAPAPIFRNHQWRKSHFVFGGSTGWINLTRFRINFRSNLTICI